MTDLHYPDAHFDAVVSVFSIFFVEGMVRQVRELWRMVRPGGWLAITTWGPRMFEPGTTHWWDAVQDVRPDLVPAVSPWSRITEPKSVRGLLNEAGIADPDIVAEAARQPLAAIAALDGVTIGVAFSLASCR